MKFLVKKIAFIACFLAGLMLLIGCEISNFTITINASDSKTSETSLISSSYQESSSVENSSTLTSYDLICLQSKNVLGIGSYLYEGGCLVKVKSKNSLPIIVVPETLDGYVVKGIEEDGFYEQKQLETVVLPDTVEIIKYGAFNRCSKLTNINMPSSLKIVEGRAFSRTNINQLVFSEGLVSIDFAMCETCLNLERVVLPNSLKVIGDNAFSDCPALNYVQIPNNLIEIGECAFNGCDKLGELNLPSTVIRVGTYAFSGNRITKEYNLPANLTTIPSGIYSGCDLITEIDIKPNFQIIGESAYAFTSITSVTIPSTIKEIKWFSFSNCNKLESIIVEEGIKVLPQRMCANSMNIKNITLPSTMTTVHLAFDIDFFESITYNGTEEQLMQINGIEDYIGPSTIINCQG